MARSAQAFDAEIVRAHDPKDWRALWEGVLERTSVPASEIPIDAVAWAFEVLCRAGVELERVMLFVQAIWARFARVIGPVVPHVIPPRPADAPLPKRPGPRSSAAERSRYERELEAQIEEARTAAANATVAFEAFAELVDQAGERFGDARTWHVNVLGWALEVLYRRGYTELELANIVTGTWEVVRLRQEARRDARGAGPARPRWAQVSDSMRDED